MELLRVVVGLLVLGGFLYAVYAGFSAWNRSDLRRAEAVMHAVADRLGGTVQPGRANMFIWVAPVLVVTGNGVRVEARTFYIPRRGQSTSVSASVAAPVFRIRPASKLDGWLSPAEHPERALGGHAHFDQHFAVAAPDHGAVQSLLGNELRDELIQMPDVWLSCDGTTLDARSLGTVGPERLERLIRVVTAIASAAPPAAPRDVNDLG